MTLEKLHKDSRGIAQMIHQQSGVVIGRGPRKPGPLMWLMGYQHILRPGGTYIQVTYQSYNFTAIHYKQHANINRQKCKFIDWLRLLRAMYVYLYIVSKYCLIYCLTNCIQTYLVWLNCMIQYMFSKSEIEYYCYWPIVKYFND